MKKEYIRTHIFNFRLFLEGLKRLRVIGLASGILAVTVSMLIPIAMWIECIPSNLRLDTYGTSSADYAMIEEVQADIACIPAFCMVLLAPFFVMVLFSFLRKRKDSDFFHAIPYSRTCVYISFSLAALAFVATIQIVSALTAGALWAACPYYTLDVGSYIGYILVSILAAAFVSSFMAVASTVSGTTGSCVLLFGLFISFVRVVFLIFLSMMDTIAVLPDDYLWGETILSPYWSLPLSLFLYVINGQNLEGISIFNPSRLVYHVVVTLILFVLGSVLYKFRRSEMAGNPAPGRRTQALFRIMFTLMLALLFPMIAVTNTNIDISLLLVLLVAVLLVYFLYELITTKCARNMLRAIPGLGIVAGVCVAFLLLFFGYRTVVLYENIEAKDIKSVTLNVGYFRESSYQYYLGQEIRLSDDAVKEIVAEQFAFSQENINNRNIQYIPAGEWSEEKDYGSIPVISYRETVTIRLRNGRKLKRQIMFTYDQVDTIHECMDRLDIYRDIRYSLPDEETVERITFGGQSADGKDRSFLAHRSRHNAEQFDRILQTFVREYEALNAQEKSRVMNDSNDYLLVVYGEMPLTYSGHLVQSYGNSYHLDEVLFPDTVACI